MSGPRVLLIDNYDSFVGNLYQYLGELGAEPIIRRNDEITVEEASGLGLTHLLVSPGPKRPEHAGVSSEMIRAFAGAIPILGVCLGHQCIGEVFGGEVVPAKRLVHGKTSGIEHDGSGVLAGIPSPFRATRYHSLSLSEANLPECLFVTARTADGEVMAVRHRDHPVAPIEGLQFHPEAILTEHGRAILGNFLAYPRVPDGLFETVMVRGGKPVLLEPHLSRLAESAQSLGLTLPESIDEIRRRCLAAPAAAGLDSGRLGVALTDCSVSVTAEVFDGYPPEIYAVGVDVLVADLPGHPLGPRAGHKVLPYDPLLSARERAREAGAFDVVFRDTDGRLLEGSSCNLFAVIDGVVTTPPLDRRVLPGVARRTVMAAAAAAGRKVRERDIRIDEIERADEIFLTGSLMEVVPVRGFAGFFGAPGPVAAMLLRAMRKQNGGES